MKSNFIKFIVTVLCIIASFYVAVILHEWGHGTVAWAFGYKKTFYDVQYGGWLLQRVDEGVHYDHILAAGHGVAAALIGIAGVTVTVILFLLSLMMLKKIRRNALAYSFFYWFAVLNMVATIQYFTVQTFSTEGDVGRFIHGLNISPLWVFIPGVAYVCFALYQMLVFAIPKAYVLIGIKSMWVRQIFLLVSLSIMFLLIYCFGYNPLSDHGMPRAGKFLAFFSIATFLTLFLFCNPSRTWIKKLKYR